MQGNSAQLGRLVSHNALRRVPLYQRLRRAPTPFPLFVPRWRCRSAFRRETAPWRPFSRTWPSPGQRRFHILEAEPAQTLEMLYRDHPHGAVGRQTARAAAVAIEAGADPLHDLVSLVALLRRPFCELPTSPSMFSFRSGEETPSYSTHHASLSEGAATQRRPLGDRWTRSSRGNGFRSLCRSLAAC